MIVIDGNAAEYNVNTFANLEELLVKVMEDELENRIVTDVLVDEAQFQEEYPNQAGELETSSFDRVEIKSVPVNEFALGIVDELEKVVVLMENSSRHIAGMFRNGQEGEALALFTELLNVLHDFMGMLAVLRAEYVEGNEDMFEKIVEEVSSQFEAMSEATGSEDWQALAAILDGDFAAAVSNWKGLVAFMREKLEIVCEG
ncbi:hypothetical protein [Halodesulfovibrio spirochaetisodalis]|uniref:Uncharacterized protein n=1 Tax=Halodesulfovibrio spirochaetisodalis TaxID=1560234 RepID=A0A1B7XE25_9BACT|nr:hypothetical protein [Halodesulfovibrio spirochaetisodalis]OBQ52409.1 hypothetical protein SP90_07480 [Halodesulfovibrio spirochaetisodalis]